MKKEDLQTLLDKYHRGDATAEEQRIVAIWYDKIAKLNEVEEVDDVELAEAGKAIWSNLNPERTSLLGGKWVKTVAVAATLVLIVGGYLLSTQQHKRQQNNFTAKLAPVLPGKNGATLTLANGKKINLTEIALGQVAEESGVSIIKTNDNKIIYQFSGAANALSKTHLINTARGESFQMRLPDGTDVWLNAASSIAFSPCLNKAGQRVVKLSGEAYFEVAKDKRHPFIVETNKQRVEVLGTHFNVTAYSDDEVATTTLLEGSVRLQDGNKLIPGQHGVTTTGKTLIEATDVTEAVAWKNGNFIFNAEDINSVVRKLARWYNVTLVFAHGEIPEATFTGNISREENIQNIINQINYTGAVRLKLDGRRILVMP